MDKIAAEFFIGVDRPPRRVSEGGLWANKHLSEDMVGIPLPWRIDRECDAVS